MAVAQSEAVSASDADAQLVPGLHWRWSPAMAAALQAAPNRPQASASGAAPLLSPGALLGASPGASPGASLGASPLPHRRPHWDQASPAQMEADIAMCQEATDAAVASLLAAVRRAHEDEEHALRRGRRRRPQQPRRRSDGTASRRKRVLPRPPELGCTRSRQLRGSRRQRRLACRLHSGAARTARKRPRPRPTSTPPRPRSQPTCTIR